MISKGTFFAYDSRASEDEGCGGMYPLWVIIARSQEQVDYVVSSWTVNKQLKHGKEAGFEEQAIQCENF